jgi:AraC-like DNA-binding protein
MPEDVPVSRHCKVTAEDRLPEDCHYRDEGCVVAPSCLNCPLPVCIYDIPRGKQRHFKEIRDQEIKRLFHQESKSTEEIAQIFGVSERTVQRALKQRVS